MNDGATDGGALDAAGREDGAGVGAAEGGPIVPKGPVAFTDPDGPPQAAASTAAVTSNAAKRRKEGGMVTPDGSISLPAPARRRA
jgi:hypothetical protein